MVTLAFAFVAIAGLVAWIPATRLYVAARRMDNLAWALNFGIVAVLATGAAAMAIGFGQGELLGVLVGLGVGGLFALTISMFAWMQASAVKTADERLHETLAENPKMAERFRQHWFFKRILRNK